MKHKDAIVLKTFKPCRGGIHWRALAEYSQMSNRVTGFQSFRFFAAICIARISHQQHKGQSFADVENYPTGLYQFDRGMLFVDNVNHKYLL